MSPASLPPQQNNSNEFQLLDIVERPPSSHHEPEPSAQRPVEPISLHVLALLIPVSTFGVLARLGLLALGTYDGSSIFPLIYVQAVGCLIMGFTIELREPFGRLYVIPVSIPRSHVTPLDKLPTSLYRFNDRYRDVLTMLICLCCL